MKKLNFSITNFDIIRTYGLYDDEVVKRIDNPDFHLYAVVSTLESHFTSFRKSNGGKIELEITNGKKKEWYTFLITNFDAIDKDGNIVNVQKEKFVFTDLDVDVKYNLSRTKAELSGCLKINDIDCEFGPIIIDADEVYISNCEDINFNVEYIGQSYGNAGEKNCYQRDKSHSTIQKIIAEKEKDFNTKCIYIIMMNSEYIEINNNFMIGDKIIAESPYLINITDATKRSDGKYLNLLEAFLINYFKPKYNSDFVCGIVPSSKHTSYSVVLDDNYDDFSVIFTNQFLYTIGIDVTLSTNSNTIKIIKGAIEPAIHVSFKTANTISPEDYYYSFFDYDNNES